LSIIAIAVLARKRKMPVMNFFLYRIKRRFHSVAKDQSAVKGRLHTTSKRKAEKLSLPVYLSWKNTVAVLYFFELKPLIRHRHYDFSGGAIILRPIS